MHTITCEDCGDARTARNSNTRYCVRCRLLRNLLFVGARTQKCPLCREEFAPVAKGDDHCAEHAFGANVLGHCKLCQRDDVELHRKELPLCMGCLRTPAHRHRVVLALRKGQRDAISANRHPIQYQTEAAA